MSKPLQDHHDHKSYQIILVVDTPNILGRPLAIICSDVENDDANSPHEGVKRFITHLMRFYGESRGAPNHVQNSLEGTGKGNWPVFNVIEGWGWTEGNLDRSSP